MHLPAFSPRRLIGAAALACAAALIPVAALAAASPPAHAAAARAAPGCATSGLVIWFSADIGGGYAGGYFYTLHFTNLSGHACTLRGYPGVSAVSLSGRRLGSPAGWGPRAKSVVRLASGATAVAQLQVEDVGAVSCHQVTAAGLRVYPPGQVTSKVVPYPLGACSEAGPVWMFAGPVRLG